jgi:hypothetical protein
VGGRLDRHQLLDRVDAEVDARELGDVGQALLDDVRVDVGQVEVDVVLVGSGAAPVADLEVHRARDHVARREVLDRRGVALHEALPLAVAQDAALAARALGEQHAELVEAGGVELVELRVLDRDAAPVGDRHQVAGERVGVAGDLEDAAVAARGDDRRLGVEGVQLAGREFIGDHAAAFAVHHDQVEHVELVEED